MDAALPQKEKVAERPIVGFSEVPLNYNGAESTFFLTNGSSPIRLILHTAVRGRELRAFCLAKGWQVKGRSLVVTDHEHRQKRYGPEGADDALVDPTAKQAEWVEPAGAKG